MKAKVYIRIAKSKRGSTFLVEANGTPRAAHKPLVGSGADPLPTVAFAVNFEIPDSAFRSAEQVIAEIKIPESELTIAADVTHLEPVE